MTASPLAGSCREKESYFFPFFPPFFLAAFFFFGMATHPLSQIEWVAPPNGDGPVQGAGGSCAAAPASAHVLTFSRGTINNRKTFVVSITLMLSSVNTKRD